MLLLFTAALPLIAGALLPCLRIRSRRARMLYVLIVTCLTSALCLYGVFAGQRALWAPDIEIPIADPLTLRWALDDAGRVYLGVAALLWPFAVLYAVDYMKHERREGRFFTWYTMTFGVAVLLACAANLFTLYVSYEFLTLLTVPLVWHEKDDESTRSARQYMIYLFGGAALGFVAMMGLYALGAGAFHPGGEAGLTSPWLGPIALLGFVGFGAKAAVLPLSRWLPKASVAPTPVTALLHAVAVVNAGVFAVARLLYYVIPPSALRGGWAQTAMLILSAATVLYGSAMAVREQHMKRRLAWSTVSNLSYMLFGLSLLSGEGLAAGLSHMVFHGMTKIILFFCAGSVMVQTGRTQVRSMHGLGKYMPLTFGAYALAGISLMGVPPMPGFVSKYALVTAAFSEGGLWPYAGAVALLISAVLTAVYIFTVVFPAFFMKPALGENERPREGGACMRASLMLLCLILLLGSVFAGNIMAFLSRMAEVIGG
ncbi:MAG: proton-conducting membrane transporter [Clostridia bacterium]|nr:proton-conducting membrane transporter [Clostridia bacterium]